jgi:hypothetical protein
MGPAGSGRTRFLAPLAPHVLCVLGVGRTQSNMAVRFQFLRPGVLQTGTAEAYLIFDSHTCENRFCFHFPISEVQPDRWPEIILQAQPPLNHLPQVLNQTRENCPRQPSSLAFGHGESAAKTVALPPLPPPKGKCRPELSRCRPLLRIAAPKSVNSALTCRCF